MSKRLRMYAIYIGGRNILQACAIITSHEYMSHTPAWSIAFRFPWMMWTALFAIVGVVMCVAIVFQRDQMVRYTAGVSVGLMVFIAVCFASLLPAALITRDYSWWAFLMAAAVAVGDFIACALPFSKRLDDLVERPGILRKAGTARTS